MSSLHIPSSGLEAAQQTHLAWGWRGTECNWSTRCECVHPTASALALWYCNDPLSQPPGSIFFEMVTPSCVPSEVCHKDPLNQSCENTLQSVRSLHKCGALCWLLGRRKALCCWHNCPPQRWQFGLCWQTGERWEHFASSFSFKIRFKRCFTKLAGWGSQVLTDLLFTLTRPPAPSPTALTLPELFHSSLLSNKPIGKPA